MKKPGSYKAARELIDQDYLDKLTPEEIAWLKKFNDEFYLNRFKKKKSLHPKKADKKKRYEADNARRRDIWNNEQRIDFHPDYIIDEDTADDPEDK